MDFFSVCNCNFHWVWTRTKIMMKKKHQVSRESEFFFSLIQMIQLYLLFKFISVKMSILLCSALGSGFHPGPSRRWRRNWLRLHKSANQNKSNNTQTRGTSNNHVFTLVLMFYSIFFPLSPPCVHQKSDIARYPDVAQRTLFLLDEVSRKRGLFEKEQQAASPTSPLGSRQVQSPLTVLLVTSLYALVLP